MEKISKVVAALPTVLTPDTIYLVRRGDGFDMYVTDATATPTAKPLNPTGGEGGDTTLYTDAFGNPL